VLSALGKLVKLDSTSGNQLASIAVGADARHISVTADGSRLYVPRFKSPLQPGENTGVVLSQIGNQKYGGEVLVVDAATMTVQQTIILEHSVLADAENQGRGLPNYLGALAISPDGTAGVVPSKLDNLARGGFRDGLPLIFQNTVRAVSSQIDINSSTEVFSNRIDHDNASLASAVTYDPYGVYEFVALETSREVAVNYAHERRQAFRINVGRAPQALLVSPD
jgi:DNA-binding beta-propeller fold protein YncE